MSIRTTIDIPEPLHDRLRSRAERTGTSIRRLIVDAIELAYKTPQRKELITGPFIHAPGQLGSEFPKDENPYDLIFS